MSKISDKLMQFREYRAQKKLVRCQGREVSDLYDKMQVALGKITVVHYFDDPFTVPQNFGTPGQPCIAVSRKKCDLDPYVLDYNIAYAGPEYTFHCPFYSDNEPCNFGCRYNSANAKYFAIKAAYADKARAYNKNSARLRELYAKFWGCNKSK